MQGKPIAVYEPVYRSDEDYKKELMQKYMDMDDYDFIHEYAEAVGDDTILAVLQDSLGTARKWEIIFDAIDEDVIDELLEAYVSVEDKRQLFLDTQDRTELCSQLVDLNNGW
jgi:HKD family nuclease